MCVITFELRQPEGYKPGGSNKINQRIVCRCLRLAGINFLASPESMRPERGKAEFVGKGFKMIYERTDLMFIWRKKMQTTHIRTGNSDGDRYSAETDNKDKKCKYGNFKSSLTWICGETLLFKNVKKKQRLYIIKYLRYDFIGQFVSGKWLCYHTVKKIKDIIFT